MEEIILVIISWVIIFIIGIGIGGTIRKVEVEQKLCELKQYEYCSKEQLLKTIK